jgi:DNA-binding transcriptional LysR family regulator
MDSSRIDLPKIREFLTLADTLNFSRAADILGLSQPALSRHVQELEQDFGTQLLLRGTNPMSLTEAGRKLQKEGHILVEMANRLGSIMAPLSHARNQTLRIGFVAGMMGPDIAESLHGFQRAHPEISAHCYELCPSQQVQALREGQLDMAFVGSATPQMELSWDFFEIESHPFRLVMAADSPLAAQPHRSVEDLRELPFIGLDESKYPGFNHQIESVCRKAGFNPHFVAQADGFSSLMVMIAVSGRVTLMPDSLRVTRQPGIVFRELDTHEIWKSQVLVARGEARPSVRRFLQHTRETRMASLKIKKKAAHVAA